MLSNEARLILKVTSKTLKDWAEKGLISHSRNELGWRIFDRDEVIKFRDANVIRGRKTGHKLKKAVVA